MSKQSHIENLQREVRGLQRMLGDKSEQYIAERKEVENMRHDLERQAGINSELATENERLRRIATAAEYVYVHFKDDLTQGFKTRDKTFAVEVLGPPLGL